MIAVDLRDFRNSYRGLLVSAAKIVWCLALAAIPALGRQEQSGGQTSEKPVAVQSDPHASASAGLPTHAVEIGGGYGSYTGDLSESDSQSVRLSFGKPSAYRWVFDVGRQHRFGTSSIGTGITYFRSFARDVTLSVGGGTGTGKFLAPRYSFGLGVMKPIFGIVTSVSYQRVQSKVENASDGVGLGFMRYQGHWIASASARVDVGHPGNTKSPGFLLGLTYYVYRKTYIGLGTDFGRASYMLISAGRTLVNYTGRGYNINLSQRISPNRGFNLRFNYGETSFYKVWGITFSIFQEW